MPIPVIPPADTSATHHGTGSLTLAPFAASGAGSADITGTGSLTMAAFAAYGAEDIAGTGSLIVAAFTVRGAEDRVGAASTRMARFTMSGAGTVADYSGGAYTGTGSATLAAFTLRGMGTVRLANGSLPPADPPPPGRLVTWPPVAPTGSLTSGAHTLIGNIAVSIGGVDYTPYAENLQCDSNVSGGFGSCTMTLRPPTPVPSHGEAVIVQCAEGLIWSGTVVNTPSISYTGEFIRFEVVAEGPMKSYGRREDFSWMSSDSDTGHGGNWTHIDCQNWNAAPAGFEITPMSGSGIGFQSADLEYPVRDYTPTNALRRDGVTRNTSYGDYEGNTPPPAITAPVEGKGAYSADCLPPKVLWSAHYYRTLDDQPLTGLKARAFYDLRTPDIDAESFRDLTDATANSEGGYGWLDNTHAAPLGAAYGTANLWTDILGLAAPPGSMWAGIYVIDSPRDLPVQDPIAMYDHAKLLHRFDPRTNTVQGEYAKDEYGNYIYDAYGNLTYAVTPTYESVALTFSGKMIVFYSTYVVTQTPWWWAEYFPQADMDAHVYGEAWPNPMVRRCWYASNELRTEGRQYVELRNVEVLANDGEGGGNDLAAAIAAASGGGNIDAVTAADGVDVKIEPYATPLAAIQQLVGMSSTTLYWGWDPVFFCTANRGSVTFDATNPGVTVSASVKNEGAVETATVIYSDAMDDTDGGAEDRRVLAAWVPYSLTFDVDGNGVVTPAENSGLLDGSYLLHSAAAAADAAQSYIVERGTTTSGNEWEGTITLRGIEGAAVTRVGTKVTCGDVTDAVITAVSVDVDSDTVTLSLGGTGYVGRFPGSPGQPYSAAPSNSAAYRKTLPYQMRK